MPPSINLQHEHLAIVRSFLRSEVPDREVRAFGSRVHGNAKPMSDLDLCIMGTEPLPATVMARLDTIFSESALPIKVDIVEWATLTDQFRSLIEKHFALVQRSESRK